MDRLLALVEQNDGVLEGSLISSLELFVGHLQDLDAHQDALDRIYEAQDAQSDERGNDGKNTLVGVAASGTTPYVIGAIKEARKRGLLTACITSNPGSPITEVAEIPITPVVGPEFVTGSSRMKSGTSQKLICNMITTSIMIGLGRVRGNKMVNMQLSNQNLVDRGTRMLVEELGLPYDEAKSLLLIHGEVQRAIDAYRSAEK